MGIMIDKNRRKFRNADVLGGGAANSDKGGQRGEGGQKRAHFCGRPIWMPPKPTDYIEEQSGVSFSLLKILPDFLNKPD